MNADERTFSIEEVRVIPLEVHTDDRGHLFEVIRKEGKEKHAVCHKFGQVYIVHNPVRNVVRAWHRHKELWDFFCVVKGRAKFLFVDEQKKTKEVVLSARAPQLIVVPTGIWHGWVSLEDDTILLSIASETYVKEQPDEERDLWFAFNYLFSGNPFDVKFR